MELSVNQRAQMVVKWLAKERSVNQKDIGLLLGYPNNTYFSNLLSGRKSIPPAFLEKLAALDPRINIDFLSGISDEMLIGAGAVDMPEQVTEDPQVRRVGIYVPKELTQLITDMTSVIKEQQAMIRTLVDAWVKRESK